jgi:hypothetical protein
MAVGWGKGSDCHMSRESHVKCPPILATEDSGQRYLDSVQRTGDSCRARAGIRAMIQREGFVYPQGLGWVLTTGGGARYEETGDMDPWAPG